MCRQNRSGVTYAAVDLLLNEVLDVLQVRPTKVRAREYGSIKIRVGKERPAQISGCEIGPVQARLAEVGPRHIGSFKVSFR